MARQTKHLPDDDKLRATEQQLKATIQQLQASEQQLRAANQQLDASNQQLRATQEELRRLNYDLAERVKELNCLYGLSRLVERGDITLQEIFQGLVELIPPAWQYPEVTAARITFENQQFKTNNFRKTAWLQPADIKVHARKAGTIEVCYLKKRPIIDEGPFLKDERNLLNALAERLGRIVERRQAEEALSSERDKLISIFEAMEDGVYIVNQQHDIQYVNPILEKDFGPWQGCKCYQYFHDRKEVCPWCRNEEVFAGKTVRWEWYSFKNQRTYDLIDTPLKNPDGSISKLEIFRDITERKRAEEALKATNQQLRASEQQLRAANQQLQASQQQLLDHEAQLKSLASQLTLTEEYERHRVATDLHATIGQNLVISKLQLDALRASAPSGGDLARTLEQVTNLLDETVEQTRTLVSDLSSPILYELGFETAVTDWLTEQIKQKHNIKTEFEDDRQPKPLDNDIRVLLFRNVRELLVNVVKHAHAGKVKVSISKSGSQIEVSVEDDGWGFDSREITGRGTKKGGFGLFSIRERLEQLGGHFEIKSAPGYGCKVTMTASLKEEKH